MTRPEEIRDALAELESLYAEGVRRDVEIMVGILEDLPLDIWPRLHACMLKLDRLGEECCRDLGLEPRVDTTPDRGPSGLTGFLADLQAFRDWWESMSLCLEEIRFGILNWERAVRFANEHEAQMKAAQVHGRPHPGWLLLDEANERLTWLGDQCMTEAQRAAGTPLPQQPTAHATDDVYVLQPASA